MERPRDFATVLTAFSQLTWLPEGFKLFEVTERRICHDIELLSPPFVTKSLLDTNKR